jgi:hypothetical protein
MKTVSTVWIFAIAAAIWQPGLLDSACCWVVGLIILWIPIGHILAKKRKEKLEDEGYPQD